MAGLSRVEQERVQGRSQNVEVIRSPLEQRRGALAQSINLEEEEEEVARIDEDIAREATARREREAEEQRLRTRRLSEEEQARLRAQAEVVQARARALEPLSMSGSWQQEENED